MNGQEGLIEEITRRVLAELQDDSAKRCVGCRGGCASECSEKVRALVDEGACRVSFHGNGADVPADLARYIDHTLLRPDATAAEIDRLCDEATEYSFAAVCVNPVWVRHAKSRLRGSRVEVASVVGFPLGANSTEIKVLETRRALREGAREIDMVINIGALKGGDYEVVRQDISRVADACREVGAVCKVILETALLGDEEKVIACRLAQEGKADFVKTSTGFGPAGATAFDVALLPAMKAATEEAHIRHFEFGGGARYQAPYFDLGEDPFECMKSIRETVGPEMGVKASGGIRTTDDAQEMIAAGATRIGASAGISIIGAGGESQNG